MALQMLLQQFRPYLYKMRHAKPELEPANKGPCEAIPMTDIPAIRKMLEGVTAEKWVVSPTLVLQFCDEVERLRAASVWPDGFEPTDDASVQLAVELSYARDEVERLTKENYALRSALVEVRDAEWMVTHDWGGDRKAVLAKIDALVTELEAKGEGK